MSDAWTPPKSGLSVSLVQMDSTDIRDENLSRMSELVSSVPPSDLIVLPEVCAYRGDLACIADMAEPLNGPIVEHVADVSRTQSAWLLLGSFPERDGDCVFNTAVLFNPRGERVATYRKMHLFGVNLAGGTSIDEAQAYAPGELAVSANIEGWQTGLSICYDLRFPEYFRALAQEGLDIALIPADFTAETGRAHWELLCRSRAIENQCYVIAANQCGQNRSSGTASYGHSMIIDPWGEILAQAGDEECILTAPLSLQRLEDVRQKLPALKHRRL